MRIAYLTNGLASTLNSSLELSRRLTEAGHDVIYVSPADLQERVAAYGYRFERLVADQGFQRELPDAVPIRRPAAWLRSLPTRRRIMRASMEHDEVERTIAGIAPDVLLIDYEMHTAVIASRATGIPTLLPMVWFTVFRQLEIPPMNTMLPIDRSPAGRARIVVAWAKIWIRRYLGAWKDRLSRTVSGDIFRPLRYDTGNYHELRAHARRKDFNLRRETSRLHFLKPFVYLHIPALAFNVREMEFPHRSRPGLIYTGPMVLHDRKDAAAGSSRERVARFLAERDSARPLVYCSLGTYWAADTELLSKIVDAFRRRSDWDLVLGLGGTLDPGVLGPVPANVLPLGYAPQVEILQQADCAITHGGITTINESIEFGVPLVVYSTGHVDQNGCAARVAHHTLGVVAGRGEDSAAIEANIERALTDETIAQSVQAMQHVFATYRSPDRAVRAVEEAGALSLG